MQGKLPWIGITMGDPTGIGPEIIVGSIASGVPSSECIPVVIGRVAILEKAAQVLGVDVTFIAADSWAEAREQLCKVRAIPRAASSPSKQIICLQTGRPDLEQLVAPKLIARVDPRAGQMAYDCLIRGANLCLLQELDAIVTAPLHKVALHGAGHDWPGHTELLAHVCGVRESAMMLYLPPGKPRHGGPAGLGVVHVTLHCALRDVFAQLTVDNIVEKIVLADSFFRHLRQRMQLDGPPQIAVAALNPHGGEQGRFGDEEGKIIQPAVEFAKQKGILAFGPLPVDTLMHAAAAGDYDAVVAMYHDQGHIALKLLDMFEAVNITLGLPIVRTSVAHGTAHDIAWQGKAQHGGMTQAILAAARLTHRKE